MKATITSCLSLAAMLFAGQAHAENYFFSVNGAGDMDGSSWENAAPGEYLGSTVSGLEPGDAVYIQGGTYLPDRNTGLWDIPQGVLIKGGYGPEKKGTDVTITYPTATETIFTADVDGDGKGDNGGRAFVVIANVLTDGWKGDKTYEDYQQTTLAGITITKADYTGESTYKGAALFGVHANVVFDHMKFVDNTTHVGGGVVSMQGCKSVFTDCSWIENHGTNAGVGLIARQHNGGSTEGNKGGITILDRCEFINNTVADPDNSNVARYGGALALADWGGTMYINNLTATGTHISWAGGFARIGGGGVLYMSNCTLYDCTCSYDVRHSGSILSMGDKSKLYAINTIAVNPEDGFDGMLSTMFIQTNLCTFETKGYNVWGSLMNSTNTPLAATDDINKDNTTKYVFGDNGATTANGMNVIAPLESFRKVTTSDLTAAAKAWDLPSEIDVTLDQTGAQRPAVTIPGAYDIKATMTDGISEVNAAQAADGLTITAIGGRRYCVEGAQGNAAVYDLSGRKAIDAEVVEGGVLDLSKLSTGLYIVSVGNKVAKLAL